MDDNDSLQLLLDGLTIEEKRNIASELRLAACVQRAMLPNRKICYQGWQSDFLYLPAGLVGGDCCDLFGIRNRFFFMIGDVSGKGLGASLLAGHLQATFRGLAEAGLALHLIAEKTNQIFYENTSGNHFATLVAGCANHNGTADLINAGHLPVLHIRDSEVRMEESTGPPVGLFRDARFQIRHLSLKHGESLLICTDGVTEACNAANHEYGIHRLMGTAFRHRTSSPVKLLEECKSDISSFIKSKPQTDDITLLSILHQP